MKIIITGAGGQLATALGEVAGESALAFSKDQLDISNLKRIEEIVGSEKPDVIINCAALTDVDGCELHPEDAYRINAIGPFYLAKVARRSDFKLVHISTDYVFSGEKSTPYVESDCPGPISIYGISKYAGERAVLSICPPSLVIRVSGLYGPSSKAGRYNFVLFVLRKAEEEGEVPLVTDQVLSPSYTKDVAHGVMRLLEEEREGIYHLANEGSVSWAKFGEEVLKLAGKNPRIRYVTWLELRRHAMRPRYSAITSEKLTWKLPPWKDALKRYVGEVLTSGSF